MEYGVPSEICRKYNHDNSIDIKLKDGREIKLDNSDEASDTIISFNQKQTNRNYPLVRTGFRISIFICHLKKVRRMIMRLRRIKSDYYKTIREHNI